MALLEIRIYKSKFLKKLMKSLLGLLILQNAGEIWKAGVPGSKQHYSQMQKK
jgi:hypothetical protein